MKLIDVICFSNSGANRKRENEINVKNRKDEMKEIKRRQDG